MGGGEYAKAKNDRDPSAAGPFQGMDYDLILHCTIGHLHSVNRALPDFADGTKALDFSSGKGTHRYKNMLDM